MEYQDCQAQSEVKIEIDVAEDMSLAPSEVKIEIDVAEDMSLAPSEVKIEIDGAEDMSLGWWTLTTTTGTQVLLC